VAAAANANTAFFMSEESFFISTIPSTMHPTALLGLVWDCEDLNPTARTAHSIRSGRCVTQPACRLAANATSWPRGQKTVTELGSA
jgi:hypothetical protein